MTQDRLRANSRIGREGIGKLGYVVDIAGNSVLSSSQPMEIG